VRVISKGHSGYAESGGDIVCAATSAILITALNGCEKLAKISLGQVTHDGFLEFWLPEQMTAEQSQVCAHVLDAMAIGIKDLAAEYPSYVKSEEIQL
jgi:uncharacterized protein YsxB (DUF464 family)